jgi:AraC family transcriptional regulator, transcriptional activator of pobA
MPRTVPSPRPQVGTFLEATPVAVRLVDDPGLACPPGSELSAHPRRARTPRTAARHTARTHTHSTLVYHAAGEATFEQEGLWHLKPGDVMLIPAGQPHRRVMATPSQYWGVGICMPCFGLDDGLALLNPFDHVRNGASAVASIAVERQAYVVSLLSELLRQSKAGMATPNSAVQRSLLTLILNEIKTARGEMPRTLAQDRNVVTDTLRFIEQHCLQPLTLQQVARAVGRSAAYVTTALSQNTGKSVVEWITAHRIAEARRLLRHSDESVNAVAERVGYNDVTHFIRMFRRDTGVTPAVFRTAQRTNAQSIRD